MYAVLKGGPIQVVMVQYRIMLSNTHLKEIKTFILSYLDKLVTYCAVLGHILRLLSIVLC